MTLTVRRLNYQLAQILEPINSAIHTWMESLSSKDDRPRMKNEREQLWELQRPSHYIGEIVKVGYWPIGAKMVSNQPRMVSNVVTT